MTLDVPLVHIYIYIHTYTSNILQLLLSWPVDVDYVGPIIAPSFIASQIRNSFASGKENLLPMKQRPQRNQLKTEFQCKVWCVHTAGMCPNLFYLDLHTSQMNNVYIVIFNQGGSFIASISSPRPNEIQWHDILQFQIFVHDAFGVAIRDTCSVAVLKTVQRNGQKPRHLACKNT